MFRGRGRRDKAEAPDDSGLAGTIVNLDEEADDADEFDEDQPEDMSADLESQAADYLADNDVWMYGPNAEAVVEILDRLEEIGPDDARPIAEAWLAIPKSDRDQARKATRKLAENNEEITRYLQLAKEAVGSWLSVNATYPEYVSADPTWGSNCSKTAEAALDATAAVVLEGSLDENHYVALLDPWSESIAQIDAAAEAASIEGAEDDDADEDDEGEDETGAESEEEEGEFGPNTDSITDFMNRLWLLAPEQVGRLVSGWQNADRDALDLAHEGLRELVDADPEWHGQVRRAQEKLAPWLNGGRIEETAGFLGQAGQGESRKMAGPALADAVAALVLGDLLDRSDAEALYGPWFNLIGAPPLPEASAAEADDEVDGVEADQPAVEAKPAKAIKAVKTAKTAETPEPAKAAKAEPKASKKK